MKILFLDVDGVLNTRPGSLDEDKLNWLFQIVYATGCDIVLSSTWRKTSHQTNRLADVLRARGLVLSSRTPVLEKTVNGLIHASPRWKEIEQWLRGVPWKAESFVILDDEPDFGPLNAHHVRADSGVGLTGDLAAEVIERLNQPTPHRISPIPGRCGGCEIIERN